VARIHRILDYQRHQHNGVDCRLKSSGLGFERASSHGSDHWSFLDLFHDCSHHWMAWIASVSRFHSTLQRACNYSIHQIEVIALIHFRSWGMRGGFWPVLNRLMTGAIWASFRPWSNTLPILIQYVDGHSTLLGRSSSQNHSRRTCWS
jgi:hypothetical protein